MAKDAMKLSEKSIEKCDLFIFYIIDIYNKRIYNNKNK